MNDNIEIRIPANAAGTAVPILTGGIGRRITAIARHIGGKRKLAEVAGLSESQLHRIVSGESKVKIDALAAMAKASGVYLDWLAMGEGLKWKFTPPKKASEAVQDMREFIDAIIDNTEIHYTEDDKTVKRSVELESDALAYVEQLAIMSLGKQGNTESDGDKFIRLAASIEAISDAMMEYGDDAISSRLQQAILTAAVEHGMNDFATRLILNAIMTDNK